MGIFSDYCDKLAQEKLASKQELVHGLYTGWQGLTKEATTQNEVLTILNNAVKIVAGLKEDHTSPATFYNQFVINSNDTIAVYYCNRTNTIKAI